MSTRGERLSRMSPAKLELVARELERLQLESRQRSEPIAIVGLGCRFPGGANDSRALWALLESGRDVCARVPVERGWCDSSEIGYFVDDPFRFDAALFGISPREARAMDPQQRMLLEVVWQAIESAGYSPLRLTGARMGVFVGMYADDFAYQLVWSNEVGSVDAHTTTGTSHASAVGRIAHSLGLAGPAIAIDTACSSSLVAVHLACEALRRSECDSAVAGGASLALSGQLPLALRRARMLSHDGRSKTFDASADGYGRGEGAGVVVLKRLSDALREGDTVRAVIRGSAVNHDGRASSLTAPNGSAQVDVIRRALSVAGVEPQDVDAVECHGTGTPIGDPIEVKALREVFASDARRGAPLRLTAIKSNLGHLEAAAGIAGLIKMALALEARALPASLHVKTLNPDLEADRSWMEVVTSFAPWHRPQGVRTAGVSSFGFGGTNAHVVLQEAPPATSVGEMPAADGRVLTLSAGTAEGLEEVARRLLNELRRESSASLSDICFTANVGRARHRYRAAINAQSESETGDALAALASGGKHSALRKGVAPSTSVATVFQFTGQGAQFPGMGRQLYERLSTFREALHRCQEILAEVMEAPLTGVLYGAQSGLLSNTRYAQPAIFALEYALARHWIDAGLRPDAVMGHSVGEYVAAHLAGVFDLETGLRLIAERGRLMGSLPAGGAMAALLCEPDVLHTKLSEVNLEVAALNGPAHTVVSGCQSAVEEVLEWARREGIRGQRLDVSHAFHSALMDPVLESFRCFVESQSLHVPALPVYSNLTGDIADGSIATSEYWVRHLRSTVRYADGVRAAARDGYRLFLEVGPASTLSSLGVRVVTDDAVFVPTMSPRRSALGSLGAAYSQLFVAGHALDWSKFQAAVGGRRCELPPYPFGGERYVNATALRGESRFGEALREGTQEQIVGRRRAIAGSPQFVYERRILNAPPEDVVDHRLFGRVVVPGAYYVAMALAVAAREWPGEAIEITDAQFESPLVLAEQEQRELQSVCQRDEPGFAMGVFSASPGEEAFVRHAQLRVMRLDCARAIGQAQPQGEPIDDFYAAMDREGFGLGPRFRWLRSVRRASDWATSEIATPTGSICASQLPPGFLDSCFQLLAAATGARAADANQAHLFVPAAIESVRVWPGFAEPLVARAAVDVGRTTVDTLVGDVEVTDSTGMVCLAVKGLIARRVAKHVIEMGVAEAPPLYENVWAEVPVGGSPNGRNVLVIGASEAERVELRSAAETLGYRIFFHEHYQPGQLEGVDRVLLLSTRPDSGPVDAAPRRVVTHILELVKGIANQPSPQPNLHIVTRGGAFAQQSERLAEGSYAISGLVRTLAFEHADISCGVIDVEDGAPLDALLLRATGCREEPVTAIRTGRLFATRLAECVSQRASVLPEVHADGSYLVTGGLGALGRSVAAWLIQRGAGRVVLMGRRPLTDGLRRHLEQLQGGAVRVEYLTCDVSVRPAVAEAIRSGTVSELPWRGVVHAAGVLDDGMLLNQDWSRFASVLAPKAVGAENLLAALEQEDGIQWWFFFSSLAGMIGSPGQANYAYANAWLDGLALRLRGAGVRALSLGFGPFADEGMASGIRSLQSSFVSKLNPRRVGRYIEDAFATGRSHVAVADLDLVALRGVHPTPTYLDRCSPSGTRREKVGVRVDLSRDRILALSAEHREEVLIKELGAAMAAIVEMPAEQLGPRVSLHSVGLDSLTSLEFKDSVERALGVRLPIALLLRGPTLEELAKSILEELPAANDDKEEEEQAADNLEHLDDRQVEALLRHLMTETTPEA